MKPVREFKLHAPFKPSGDQPSAISKLTGGLKNGMSRQTLIGVTGSGKTFAIANVIKNLQKPALILSHNKTLAAQLYREFKEFFPENAVEYFVSYYDYYQPEAYISATDTYIEKDSSINDEIDLMRLSATTSLIARNDVIVVASISCIYGLGSPQEYIDQIITLHKGQIIERDEILKLLIAIQYERHDTDFSRSTFRVRGDIIDIHTAYAKQTIRVELFGDEITRIQHLESISGRVIEELNDTAIYPAKHFITERNKILPALKNIEDELQERLAELKKQGKDLEAHRLEQRTMYDLEMLREIGYCNGIENYSRQLSFRNAGDRPSVLLDYFPDDFLMFIDESHVALPQVNGMYKGDRSRKENLIDFGFRLPSALDNRPLYFEEFDNLIQKAVFISATPGNYELENSDQKVELIIRPTGLVDPPVEIHSSAGQIDDLLEEIKKTTDSGYRILVTTLTKKMSEELTDFLSENGIRVQYLHSEIETIERVEIIHNLRAGEFDCLAGINLLREGLDLPEVGLVAILDADKAGFLRSASSLIQISGRAARNIHGRVIMYADNISSAMKTALTEMDRRREKQLHYNEKHNITPKSIKKYVENILERKYAIQFKHEKDNFKKLSSDYNLKVSDEFTGYIKLLEEKMHTYAQDLEFEEASRFRDEIKKLQKDRKKYEKK